jgi:hypothetical protein
MIHPYQLHSLSKLYHEEALHRARVRRIGHRAKAAPCRPRSEEDFLEVDPGGPGLSTPCWSRRA